MNIILPVINEPVFDETTVYIKSDPSPVTSDYIATIIRGYTSEDKSSTITSLPYVNDCNSFLSTLLFRG